MASGVGASPDCMGAYNELKLGKKLKYIIFKLSPDNTEIVVDKKSEDPDYENFLSSLPENECRYAVYDVEYDTEGGKRNKLCFYNWVPDGARIKNRMVSASSKEALRKQFVGIAADVQGSDPSEIDFQTVVEKLQRVSR